MTQKREHPEIDGESKIVSEARRAQKIREQGYRDQALKLFPHVCGRCGREFSGKKLRELTVHHRNHNHDDNPPDGSNWELLCLYCHDNEHQKQLLEGTIPPDESTPSRTTYQPFARLQEMMNKKK
ncbi:MAG TPA: YajD family HNH nuclease [Nitrospirota bacterium]|nr:YajD family HNH nuclease [Nitrospirota bacterium]